MNRSSGGRGLRNPLLFALLGLEVLVGISAIGVVVGSTDVMTVPGRGMENTAQVGDRVIVQRGHDVRRGDVVTVTAPEWGGAGGVGGVGGGADRVYMSRVIGVGGDQVASDARGQLTVNGRALHEDYVKPGPALSRPFNVKVPPGRIWVMGDNRPLQAHSPLHVGDPGGGTLQAGNVKGRVIEAGKGSSWREVTSPSRSGMPVPVIALLVAAVAAVLFLISLPVVLVVVLRGSKAPRDPAFRT
ncbi:signal peptidase I [Actinomadura barringtoniae]|uniref:Signal peptidase I n=1 Tax=Actinomadura barringtoniae TaxID=1427535 RepID=A0A939T5A5_9ACTN|nr:signal peptidase I [Actinomadura barringtoniae]MBO2450398.1 signal peptidase I [Actinomadura barringtoniae]